MGYKVGEKVIYPNQGVGIIEEICTKDIAGLDDAPFDQCRNDGLGHFARTQEAYLHKN